MKLPSWLSPRTRTGKLVAAGLAALLIGGAVLALTNLGPKDAGTVADDGETDVSNVRLAGSWRVHVEDFALGVLEGRAVVAEDEKRASVYFTDPSTGQRVRLNSTSFARDGRTLRITFEGQRPGIGRQIRPPAGEVLKGGPGALRFKLGNGEGAVQVKAPTAPAEARIEVALRISPDALTGTWRRRTAAERVPGEAFAGAQGGYSYVEDGTGQLLQEGGEYWTRLEPEIELVVPVQDTLGRDPYGIIRLAHPDRVAGKDGIPSGDRHLLVIGRDLPTDRGEPVIFGPPKDGITYSLVARQVVFADQSGWVGRAYALLAADVGPEKFEALRGLDAVLVRASFGADVLPGLHPLEINGGEGAWLLRFGDFSGHIDIARVIGEGETEPTSVVVAPETVVVELTPDRDLKREVIDVSLFAGGEPVLFPVRGTAEVARATDTRRIPARRTTTTRPDPETGKDTQVIVYRTPPIALVAQGQEAEVALAADMPRITVPEGETLRAIVADPGVFEPRPIYAAARVAYSPATVATAADPLHADQNLTWPRALVEALRCGKIDPKEAMDKIRGAADPDGGADPLSLLSRLSQAQIGSVGNLVLFNPTDQLLRLRTRAGSFNVAGLYRPKWYTVGITAGDLAAMIMLRDTFLDLMEEQRRVWADPDLRDEALDGQRLQFERAVFENDQPYGVLPVTAPDGEKIEFWRSFVEDRELQTRYGLDADGLRDWRRRATREAIAGYAGWIDAAAQRAREVDACKAEKMLELTAFGFGAIERQIAPRLLRPGASGWEPDRVARAYVFGHTLLADAVRAQQQLSAADTDRIILAAGVAGGLGAAYFGSVSAAWISFAIDAGDFGVTSLRQTVNLVASEKEVAFARGATAVLGAGRYARARREADLEYFSAYAQIALTGLAAGHSLVDAWQLGSLKQSVKRGQDLIAATEPSAFRRLSREAQEDILNAVEEARTLQKALAGRSGGAAKRGLTTAERQSFDFGENLRAEYLGRPSWVGNLPGATYSAIADMRLRPDVAKLAADNPGALAAIAKDPDALEAMRGNPFTSLDDLNKAIKTEKERIKTPYGADFYDDMSKQRPDPPGFQITDRAFEHPGGAKETVTEINIGQQDVGSFKRSLYDDKKEGMTLVFSASELYDGAPGWVDTARRNFLPRADRPGIPVALYMNARSMSNLGVQFADARVRTVLISGITNGQTAVQLNWLRRMYPDKPIDELIKYTHSFRYAETALTQAGLRVTGTRIVPKPHYGRLTAEELLGAKGSWFRADTDWRQYIARYGIEPEEILEHNHTFELKVEPIR
ncbi:MAG: hypothetical protein AB7E69_16150 [Sphingomonadales bacterium]